MIPILAAIAAGNPWRLAAIPLQSPRSVGEAAQPGGRAGGGVGGRVGGVGGGAVPGGGQVEKSGDSQVEPAQTGGPDRAGGR